MSRLPMSSLATTPDASAPGTVSASRAPASSEQRLWRSAPAFVPAVAVLALWIAWIPQDGGYFASEWYPAALLAVLMLGVLGVARGRVLPASRAARAALAAFGAFVTFSYASMLWAGSPGDGWEASNKLVLYLATAWLLALIPWRRGSATLLLGAWTLGVAVVCFVVLLGALHATELSGYIQAARWQEPSGYANGTAAIAVLAFWPALLLSARRDLPPLAQAAFMGIAVFLVEFGQLPQSRGSLVALVLTAPVLIALAPQRVRLTSRLLLVGGAIALSLGPVWAVYGHVNATPPLPAVPALHHAAAMMAATAVLAVLAVLVLALLERRFVASPALTRVVSRGLVVVVVAAVAGGAALAVANSARISRRVTAFSHPTNTLNGSSPRILAGDLEERSDYWRFALHAFSSAPVAGIGSGNFEYGYTRGRRVPKFARYAHDIWLRVLAEDGVVGALIFVVLLGSLGVGLIMAARRTSPPVRSIVAAAGTMLFYFLAHASVDWLDEIPAVAAPALALPFVALAVAHRPHTAVRRGPSPRRGRFAAARRPGPLRVAATVSGATLVLAGAASLTFPYLSLRFVHRAYAVEAASPSAALADFRRAAKLNPLSPRPWYAAGVLAAETHNSAGARDAFAHALRLEDNWLPHFELALLAAGSRQGTQARQQIARAAALNPPDPLVEYAASLIRRRSRVDPAAVNAQVLNQPLYKQPRVP